MVTQVNADALAEACNLTRRRVNQLVNEGIIPRASRGRYDLVAALRAYVRFLQQATSAKATITDDGKVVSTRNERARLLTADADLKELDLAERRGEVMAIADYEAILSALVIEVKAQVNAIGARAAGRVIGEENRGKVQTTIDAEATAALSALAKLVPAVPRIGADDPAEKPKRKRSPKKVDATALPAQEAS